MIAVKVRAEERMQRRRAERREIDGHVAAFGVARVQRGPVVQYPLDAHAWVLVDAARPPQEGLNLRQPIERSSRARLDDRIEPAVGDVGYGNGGGSEVGLRYG